MITNKNTLKEGVVRKNAYAFYVLRNIKACQLQRNLFQKQLAEKMIITRLNEEFTKDFLIKIWFLKSVG